MRLQRILIVAVALALAGGVIAQAQTDGGTPPATADGGSLQSLCIDTTGQDKQPNFAADAGIPAAIIVTNDNPPKLRLNTNLNRLDPERIILPFDQNLDALMVDDRAGNGASHTLGWFYYDELIDAGYIDIRDAGDPNDDILLDKNNNRVPDFHEDLYNVSAGANARPYVGIAPRCPGRTFNHNLWDGGGTVTLRDPDLLTGPCTGNGTTSYIANNGPKRWYAGTGYPAEPVGKGGVVGQKVRDFTSNLLNSNDDLQGAAIPGRVDTYFSDQGLFPHVPNLLEPRHELNGNRGIGHFVFLSTDDDDNNCPGSNTSECFAPRQAWKRLDDGGTAFVGPIWDTSGNPDGIPDYKASAIDPSGQVIDGEDVTAAIGPEDQRVQLGKMQGNREIVFFLNTYVEQIYGGTDSCLITRPTAASDTRQIQCDLWLHGDINTFFSKSLLNMDVHQSTSSLVTTKNLRSGWLGPLGYARLATGTYGNITFPSTQNQNVNSYNRRAAHTLVGAPTNNPLVWLLGWEDQVAGGDRTYADIVVLINKQNNGSFRSDVVSDIPIEVADDFTITEIAFDVVDQPYYAADGGSIAASCSKTVTLADGGTGTLKPDIRYEVALDCQVRAPDGGLMVNPEPNWLQVDLGTAPADGGTRDSGTVVTDLLERGRVGTQLCWRAILESPGEACQPTIANVNVSYKAQRSGQYGRASVIPMANVVVYGVHETPGRNWFDGGVDEVSPRVYDGYADTIDRGHLHMKKLYNPDTTNLTPYDPADPVWDSGKWLRDLMDGLEGPSTVTDPTTKRRLLTLDPDGHTNDVKDYMGAGDNNSPAFPNTLCGSTYRDGSKYLYDLDQNGTCNSADRTFLRDWLYGWENRAATRVVDRLRTWPMGGINISTPAVVGPAGLPDWVKRTSNRTEQDQYVNRFMRNTTVADRATVAYVGTTQGYLHAVKSGAYKAADDTCTPRAEGQGYFAKAGGCAGARDYGDGSELFAYLPYKLLPWYVENYRRTSGVPGNATADARAKMRASMDATPNVADVDLGQGSEYDPETGYAPTANNAWKLGTSEPDKGAKTALVSATGPNQSVFFALDVTDPSAGANFPRAMWEFDMKNDNFGSNGKPCSPASSSCVPVPNRFTIASVAVKPDTQGSRHAPAITRMDFGPGGKKWVSIFATDYVPASGTVGALYIMDMKTGLPVQLPGNSVQSRLAGVVTLGKNVAADLNQGIGGEPVAVDINQDGVDDVIYVPSTSGKIYRINTNLTDTSNVNKLGKVLSSCVVADAQTAPGVRADSKNYQRIFSSISAQVVTGASGNSVRLYFGTGNNPDIANEPADTVVPKPHYYVMAYDDKNPTPATRPTGDCLADFAWAKELDDGQVVWGGVAATDSGVFTTTAVGKSANVCGLSSSQSGKAYAFTSTGTAAAGNGTDLGGHGTHAPVVHDRHLVFLTADGRVMSKGSEPYGSNGNGGAGRKSNILIWDVRSGTKIQEAVP
ncbi:pilus assembly protein PilY [Pyxidicoccus parkwayensis]|uniref:Pilus assembly protein PilY n=1 Tax=Pyxidicoccus parkwayensis TaxID=2813578 RepID=A0ABX7NPC7_9BACT|nr:pilus assembly protein PilY [Pyxidicoccus parkwaysis]QSQ20229.1 pilus assembly protein PilY [Pyxidicoccus parkwaysis]